MLKKTGVVLLCLLFTFGGSYLARAWGVWGHQHINRAAVFALPEPMRAFYFNHIDFITIEASIPDLRKYVISDRQEFPRHFIDVDIYGEHPFDALPASWDSAVEKYGKDSLYRYGILPWYIQLITQKLTSAFKQHNKAKILFLSADLAHYIGDGYQPLHTTKNYDGQLSGQKGVHALFESFIPELFGSRFNLHTPPARYLKDVEKASWDIVKQSHALVRPLLASEKELLDTWPEDKIYEQDKNGKIRKNQYNQSYYSKEFTKAWQRRLDGMIEKQLQLAIQTTASFWYTAWVNAGKPDLSKLDTEYSYEINRVPLRTQYRLWKQQGRLKGIKSSAEF